MKNLVLVLAIALVAGCYQQPYTYNAHTSAQPAHSGVTETRQVSFNGEALDGRGLAVLERIEAHYGGQLPDGDYWYDRRSGAAGSWGGPTAGFIGPNLPLGGLLPANASGRGTGVFINGREIHAAEYQWLTQVTGRRPLPGRYWLEANGDVGFEGGPRLGNLAAAASASDSSGGRSWSKHMPGVSGRPGSGIGMASDGETTCVNTASYTRCY